MTAVLFFGGRGYGKRLGIPAGLEFIGLGVYKHSNEKHEEMN
jgi:hypothetical protein